MSLLLEKIQKLREETMAPMGDIKKALEEANGNEQDALLILKKRGKVIADKKASRETNTGIISSYTHRDGRIGVLLELRCETDFVAKTAEFQALSRDLAMHIAAMKPLYVKPEDIPQKTEKYYDEVCLLNQRFVKDETKTVKDIIGDCVAKVGENIEVSRFARFEI
ncbi:elongation factor Ts [Candidatus Azambacteria bacterium]|nr:elongation factor Ts [Candidatus Azambacteria bacterium]MBI3684874.1 elongation factor Ts [Candidatus Azambacteria bacterium]